MSERLKAYVAEARRRVDRPESTMGERLHGLNDETLWLSDLEAILAERDSLRAQRDAAVTALKEADSRIRIAANAAHDADQQAPAGEVREEALEDVVRVLRLASQKIGAALLRAKGEKP